MKHLDEYKDSARVKSLAAAIRRATTRRWNIMELCGGQTHAIARYRLDEMTGDNVTMLHGPGCPVCVTPVALIDAALRIAREPEVILASFGDMLRVPGSDTDLLRAKAAGADVRMLYSTLDAVEIAAQNPSKEVVFFAVGFETTAPAHLAALKAARQRGLKNFSLLTSLFTVPAAIEAILSQPDNRVDGLLAAGHVCAVTGFEDYHPLARKYSRPIVVTGFEPVDLLYGLYQCVNQLESGRAAVENAYTRVVTEKGNPGARALMAEMLEPCDMEWRGIGVLPQSGFRLSASWSDGDAARKFARLFRDGETRSNPMSACIAGEIMKGNKNVWNCSYFGTVCTPETPVGPSMVSDEGVCSAYYAYKQM
jgi:hydrogenase expression/formation protein HypD